MQRSTYTERNNFAEVFQNWLDADLKIILLNYRNNYVRRSNWLLDQNFLQRCSMLKFHIYFDDSTKLFSDLYLAKFLDISAKSLFLCSDRRITRVM